MRIALDTNRYVDFARGDAEAVARLREVDAIFVPVIVLGELRSGFLGGSRAAQNEALLTRFLRSPRVSVLYVDEQTTHHYASLSEQLNRQGTPLPTNDIWIARAGPSTRAAALRARQALRVAAAACARVTDPARAGSDAPPSTCCQLICPTPAPSCSFCRP